jgi:glutaredoxin
MRNFRNPFAGFGRSSGAPPSNQNPDQSTTHSSSISSIADINRQVTNAINTQTLDAERYARRMIELEEEIAEYNVRLQEIRNLPQKQKQNFRNEALDILQKRKNATSIKNSLVKPMTPNTSTIIQDKLKQGPERIKNTTSSTTSSIKSTINSSNLPYIEIDKINISSMQDLATYLEKTPERTNTDFIVNTVIPNIIKYRQQLRGINRNSKLTVNQKGFLSLFIQNKRELANQLGMYINLDSDKNGKMTDRNRTLTEIRKIIYNPQLKPK